MTLRSATETLVDEDTEHTERKSGATKDWALALQAEAGLEFGVKGGGVLVLLRNNLTGQIGTFAGGTFGGGFGAGFSIVKVQPTSFESMWMPEDMTVADFDGAWFTIQSSGFGIGVFGYEASTFYFTSEGQESSSHRVLFETEKHTITDMERHKLETYLSGVSLGL